MNCELRTANCEGPAFGGAFDSHAHFGEDWRAVLARSREAGMAGLVAVGCDERSNDFALAVAHAAPDFALLALGFDYSTDMTPAAAESWLRHAEGAPGSAGFQPAAEPHAESAESAGASPGSVESAESVPIASTSLSLCASVLNNHAESAEVSAAAPLHAIGEIGLDYSRQGADPAAQQALFERQLALAAEWNLPVIVHSRAAEADTLASLRAAGSSALAAEGRLGVLHCFVGDQAFAEQVLSLGMMVSFSGIVTFRNAESLRAVATAIPADRILVETDCPYLAPVPLRGKVNEPAFVEHTIRCLAALRGVSPGELADQTCRNALRLFAGDRCLGYTGAARRTP